MLRGPGQNSIRMQPNPDMLSFPLYRRFPVHRLWPRAWALRVPSPEPPPRTVTALEPTLSLLELPICSPKSLLAGPSGTLVVSLPPTSILGIRQKALLEQSVQVRDCMATPTFPSLVALPRLPVPFITLLFL